jgi:hypothetical protein
VPNIETCGHILAAASVCSSVLTTEKKLLKDFENSPNFCDSMILLSKEEIFTWD